MCCAMHCNHKPSLTYNFIFTPPPTPPTQTHRSLLGQRRRHGGGGRAHLPRHPGVQAGEAVRGTEPDV